MKVESGARVAFQGERGAFSEEAAVKLLGEGIVLVPRPTFEAMFDSIDENAADYILAPIENTLAGSVHRTFDLLVESRLSIIAEEISHRAQPNRRARRDDRAGYHCRIAPRGTGAVREIFPLSPGIETNRDGRYGRKCPRDYCSGRCNAGRDRQPACRRLLWRQSATRPSGRQS